VIPITVTQALELVIGAGGAGGLVKMIGQLTRIAVAIEQFTNWRVEVDHKLEEHQTRLDKGGL
jgi:hypothetical protein